LLIDGALAVLLVGLALWLRLADLTHFVTADEHNWVYRSGLFLHALLQKDWPGTSVWYTPAVTTTWLGSAGLTYFYQAHQAAIGQPLSEWAVSFSRNKIDLELLGVLRGAMALFTALMAGLVYGLARKLWSPPVALLGALFLISEPHLLAVSRIIGHDALITFFVIGALLALLYAKRLLGQSQGHSGELVGTGENTKAQGAPSSPRVFGWFALAGLLAGLAILSKAPALILIPFAGLVGLVDVWQQPARFRGWLGAWLAWGVALWLTFVLAWPAAWVDPLGQGWFVISSAFLSSAGLEDADLQPYWSIPNPGYFYYLLHGAYKASPLLLAGTLLAGAAGWKKLRQRPSPWAALGRSPLAWLLLFALLFGLMMSLSLKRSPRYILPAFPGLAFVAAWGWLNLPALFRVKWATLRQRWNLGTIVVLSGLAVGLTLVYAPYYFTYYNPLLGGSFTAPRVVRIGWGEGLDALGRWLNSQPEAEADYLGARYTATLYPFYRGNVVSPTSEELDYVAFYIKQTQGGYPAPEILAYFENQGALHRVALDGIEYVQLYKGPAMQPIEQAEEIGLPLAFRPDTIYAPIGGRLTVDLLWPNQVATRPETATLTLESAAAGFSRESLANVTQQAQGVWVSTHRFDLPADMPRETYTLAVAGKSIGQIKARRLDIPPDFRPLSAVLGRQLKLAGYRLQREPAHILLNLAWQAWPRAFNNHTVFVQLLDSQGQRVAGVDVAPQPGFKQLDRKEVRVTQYHIPLPADIQPGTYNLLVGLYYFAGDEIINVGAVTLDPPVTVD